jgi:hypothetical protein
MMLSGYFVPLFFYLYYDFFMMQFWLSLSEWLTAGARAVRQLRDMREKTKSLR